MDIDPLADSIAKTVKLDLPWLALLFVCALLLPARNGGRAPPLPLAVLYLSPPRFWRPPLRAPPL